MSRLLKITYAGLTIGKDQADSSYNLTDKYRISHSYTEFSVSFEVVVSNSTRASFLTAESTLLTAYRKPDQAVVVNLNGTDRHNYDPSSNTGFNARATCVKLAGPEDTANSARYRCSVTIQLPADLSGRSGRQSSTVTVDTTPSGKRSITIDGVYTALSSNDAAAQYAAAADTYCSSVLTDVGGTYNLLPESYSYDDQDKVLRFRRVYQEVYKAESVSATDNAAICDQKLVVERSDTQESGPWGEGGWDRKVTPLQRIRVSYSCSVKSAQTTDLKALYEGTVLPHITNQVSALTGGTLVRVGDSPSFDLGENRLAATVDYLANTGSSFLAADIRITHEIDHGIRLVPVWDGSPFSRDKYNVPQSKVITVVRDLTWVGNEGQATVPSVAGYELTFSTRTEGRSRIGGVGGTDTVYLTLTRETFRFEKANVSNASSPAAGGTRARSREIPEPGGLASWFTTEQVQNL